MKYRGVSWSKRNRRWRARIVVGGRQLTLGYFKNKIDAAVAYDEAAEINHGQFAKLNFGASEEDSQTDH